MGKDGKYEKTHVEILDSVCKDLNSHSSNEVRQHCLSQQA